MTFRLSLFACGTVLLAAAAYVLFTAASLPPIVASHFVAGGGADGFMPREAYVRSMLALVVGAPLLLIGLASLIRFVPARFVNLPHRDYWLSPERRPTTVAFIESHGRLFGVLLALFLCFVHWLVIRANGLHPPHLPEDLFAIGLLVFVAAVAGWLGVFIAHFRRRP